MLRILEYCEAEICILRLDQNSARVDRNLQPSEAHGKPIEPSAVYKLPARPRIALGIMSGSPARIPLVLVGISLQVAATL
jgi:hypothetical protein